MTCPGCRRANDPRRRYCGGCGCNLEPVCQACDFLNERDDHYCGGCGTPLRAIAAPVAAHRRPPPTPGAASSVAGVATGATISAAELAELLAPAAAGVVALPSGAIGQDDLDRLFGGTS